MTLATIEVLTVIQKRGVLLHFLYPKVLIIDMC